MTDYPHSTQILSPFTDFSNVPEDRLFYATDRGKRVHNYCAAIAKKIYIGKIVEDCQGYVASFEMWFYYMVTSVHLVEKQLIHSIYLYTGIPDLIVTIKNIGMCVIDLKTPIALSKTWKGQLASYQELAIHNDYPIIKSGTLRLHPKGKIAKMDWYENKTEDFNAFLSALTAYRYFIK